VPSCENLFCVRDADFPTEGTNPSGPAMGYCSIPCSPNTGSTPSTQEACPAANPADNEEGSPTRLTCRRLSLDEETLAAFREADPEGYRRIFGENESPYYCARGDGRPGSDGSPDAGTP
jgi:hypothetical protein